ncbi:MAG: serine/threonine protein kinase [Myxococcota bacterium]|nr:serine/threonine protein kinase [Myxococcota bacterium]
MDKPFGQHPLAGRFTELRPEHVFDVVEAHSSRCTGRFLVLNSYENRVFRLELEDTSFVVAKFYRPGRWTKDTIQAEHDFLRDLEEMEIPVVAPIALSHGGTIDEIDGIYFSIFPSFGGRAPEELDREKLEVLGRYLARMHNVGAIKEDNRRVRLTPTSYGEANLQFLLENEFIPSALRENYEITVQSLLKYMEPLFLDISYLRVHGDCHLGNLLWTPGGPTFLDFDDMVMGPAVQDIWMLVPSYDTYGQQDREILLDAYQTFRDFDRRELRLIEPLRTLRFLHYSAWIARRWDDPVFKETFNYFGTEQYWQKEVQDLREQLARLMHEL